MDFVMLANSWSAFRTNPTSKHHIAATLVRTGHRVLWVEGAGMRAPSVTSGRDWRRSFRRLANAVLPTSKADGFDSLWVISPLVIPFPQFLPVRLLNSMIVLRQAASSSKTLGFHKPVFINYVPTFYGVMERWKKNAEGSVVIYHCVDRWDAFDRYHGSLMAECDRRCCQAADIVAASSRALERRARRYARDVRYFPHGVQHKHFADALQRFLAPGGMKRPADLPPGPIIGFIGLVSEWVDQDLVVRVAAENPSASVVLIGDADVDVARLKRMGNLIVAGPRPFLDLPNYVVHFSVGIIPFLVNELTRAVNPIKLQEMLAAGCPVVSTELPEAERAGVAVARSADEFVAIVQRIVERPPSPEERLAMSRSVEVCSWDRRVAELVAMIEEKNQSRAAAGGRKG